jgi:two-component system, OmpR family, sensor kinase
MLGWIAIRLGMRPLELIGRVAGESANGDPSRPVGPRDPRTELARIASSSSESLVQIARAFADRCESDDCLRGFVADASHELRTPLASIRGYAEAFRLGAMSDPATLERAMGRIEAEAVRMGVLVEDLLQLASLGALPEQRRVPVDLCELVERAAQDTRAVAPTRDVHLAADGHAIVLADPDQITQVLANLTSNVLNHTPPDSPIELRAYHERGHAALEVRDHGPGLPADAGDRVFERFWRARGGRHRGRGGVGLGLAIVRAIVHAHDGEVHATNASDGGAVVRVTLPIANGVPLAGGTDEDACLTECGSGLSHSLAPTRLWPPVLGGAARSVPQGLR